MIEYVTGRDTKAEQLLWLLNGQQTVPLDEISLIVIVGTWAPSPTEPQDWPFRRGEIIPVAYEDDVREGRALLKLGRAQEVFGQRRSFEPWDMDMVMQQADNMAEAVKFAELAKARKDGYYERGPYGWQPFADQRAGRSHWAGAADSYVRIGDASADAW